MLNKAIYHLNKIGFKLLNPLLYIIGIWKNALIKKCIINCCNFDGKKR